jgi:N-acyl-D-aspartate/D-glutamate deacylase
MSIWKNVDPVGAIADFRTVWQQAGKNRWRIAVAAAAMTIGVFSLMFQEEHRILPRPPKVTYITSWRADRSDAEIIASNRANEIYQQKLRDEQAKREEAVREIYKKIGRASGMDVDAIEAKAKADKAAEEAAKRAAAQPKGQLVQP